MKISCWDLDDTMRDTRARHVLSPWNNPAATWDDYHAACAGDAPIPGTVAAVRLIRRSLPAYLVSSAKTSAKIHNELWLERHGVEYEHLALLTTDETTGANYPGSAALKVAYVKELQAQGYEIEVFFEDLEPVAQALESLGIPVVRVVPPVCSWACLHCSSRH
jgi:hypothetical protein